MAEPTNIGTQAAITQRDTVPSSSRESEKKYQSLNLDGATYNSTESGFIVDDRSTRCENWERSPPQDCKEVIEKYGGESKFREARKLAVRKVFDSAYGNPKPDEASYYSELGPFMTNSLGVRTGQISRLFSKLANYRRKTHGPNDHTAVFLDKARIEAALTRSFDRIITSSVNDQVNHEQKNPHKSPGQLDMDRGCFFHGLKDRIYRCYADVTGDDQTLDCNLIVHTERPLGSGVFTEHHGGFAIGNGEIEIKTVESKPMESKSDV